MSEHIVFIPGAGAREWLWRHQAADLADLATSEVMVLDQQASRAEMADHVLTRAPEFFSLAGHSLGGWVAQEVAARAPERVSALFLCDTWARMQPGTDEYLEEFCVQLLRDADAALDAHFDRILHERRYADKEFCDRLRAWLREMPGDCHVRQLRALARDYATGPLLSRIRADTLVIHGRQDRVVAEEEARVLAAGISGAALALIEESGHCTPVEQPEALSSVMRLWLMRKPGRGGSPSPAAQSQPRRTYAP
ncbi:alpha/beta fold hydrolase [Peterkaempfera sp. SMS 1(5)a]|uniref:alpha/beta fold hydrolase n=1 Tax=Peterkaempfera podocarpi TaxID=3232308 RepID=UPI00366AC7BE